MEVIAASAIAWIEEADGGTWRGGSRAGGAAAPTQQLTQVAHFACDEATFEPDSLQCSASVCPALWWW